MGAILRPAHGPRRVGQGRVRWRRNRPAGSGADPDRVGARPLAGPAAAAATEGKLDLHWDIFCQVVDNYGDIGVCWRLARGLAAAGQRVRLFVDDPSALAWMAPGGQAGVQVCPVRFATDADAGASPAGRAAGLPGDAPYDVPDVLVAAFGCALPQVVVAALQDAQHAAPARRRVPWIHLEYLSAEPYAERSHGLPSPILGGAAAGVHRWFYFPGYTPGTGGLLREPGLLDRRRRFDRQAWLHQRGIAWQGEPVIGLFCYEPAQLADWLRGLAGTAAVLLVAAGRGARALRQALDAMAPPFRPDQALRIAFLPLLAQDEFDHFLWAGDVNFVRGEDSLVRALWAGAGVVWQAYPQADGAQRAKIEAWLDWLQAPDSLREATWRWNGLAAGALPPAFDAALLPSWTAAVQAARARLLAQDDLVTRLLRFVAENR